MTWADVAISVVFLGGVLLGISGIFFHFRDRKRLRGPELLTPNQIIDQATAILDTLPIVDMQGHWFTETSRVYDRDQHAFVSPIGRSDLVDGDRGAVLAHMQKAGLMGFEGAHVALIDSGWAMDAIESTMPTVPGGRICRFVRIGQTRWKVYKWRGGKGGTEIQRDPEFLVLELMQKPEKWQQWLDSLPQYRTGGT